MISSSHDGTIRLWDVESGATIVSYDGQRAYYLAISPDGKTLASADTDGTVKLWDLSVGPKPEGGFPQPKSSVNRLFDFIRGR